MELHILNEFSPLYEMIVCLADNIPDWNIYQSKDKELRKFLPKERKWDKELLVNQQTKFLDVLRKYKVRLLFPRLNSTLPWQMFTRDAGFVYRDKFFYCLKRTLKEREGEIDEILEIMSGIDNKNIIKIEEGKVEGGDVLTDEELLYIGISNRTTQPAVQIIKNYFPVKTLFLGNGVMHLDTCMTILSNKRLLIYKDAFQQDDLVFLSKRYKFLPISKEEANNLGTNVFVINPETIVVHEGHKRIQKMLKEKGYNLEVVDYSEPINTGGSFHCTTMPTERI